MMHILFKDLLFTCSDLELSIFWKIKKEGSRTKLTLLKNPIVIKWYLFENSRLWAEGLSQVYFTYQSMHKLL